MPMNENIFREYDVRGIAERDLTDDLCTLLGHAISVLLKESKASTISLGRDCRLSSPRIHKSLLRGLTESGINVVDIGLVPTPLLYFSIPHLELDGGIMITGSHNPGEHNGFKVCVGASTIHGEEIQRLKTLCLQKVSAKATTPGTYQTAEVIEAYTDMVCKNIGRTIHQKIVIDSGNGMAGIVAPELFRKLGCEVTELFSEPDGNFPNHHPDPTVPESLEALSTAVHRTGAVVGIGFDGDADRIGVVDPDGLPVYGDELLVLYSREILAKNPGAKIISEVKASHRLFADIKKHGGVPILWKTGHSLIKAKMKEEKALLAGEMSGHMFFNDRYYGFDDAIYAAARLIDILDKEKRSPRSLLSDLPKTYSTPELRLDCPDDIKFEVVQKAKNEFEKRGLKVNGIDGARIEFPDGWGLVRASNTQPVLVYRFEANSAERLAVIRELIESTVREILSKKV